MAKSKSDNSGIIKPVIIGVLTTVFASYFTYQLGFERSQPPQEELSGDSQTVKKLLKRQTELEKRIQQYDEKELARRQEKLNNQLQAAQKRTKQSASRREDKYDLRNASKVSQYKWQLARS